MPLYVSSTSIQAGSGVFALSVSPPAAVQAEGTGVSCIVEQMPWGPAQSLYTPSDPADRLMTFAPFGMNRLHEGYLAIAQKGWPELRVLRVLGPTAALATAQFPNAVPTQIVRVTAKFAGLSGNALVGTISAASDGDANHFNLAVTVTGASGTTTDLIQNLNYSGTGADSTPDFTKLRLIGAITKLAAGIPVAGSVTFTSGTDGTITAAEYVGTAGVGDKGLALLESIEDINHVCYGDPGNSLRAACNAGMRAHCDTTGNRIGYITGNSGQSAAGAQSDVANYRSINVLYVDPWVYERDDVTQAKQLVTGAAFAASVASQLSPSSHISWRDPKVLKMLNGIVDVEAARGAQKVANSAAGIATIIKLKSGQFAFESDYTTITPQDPTQKFLTRTRMGIYAAQSMQDSFQSNVNGPNVPITQQALLNATENFFAGLLRNKNSDPGNKPYVLGYTVEDFASANAQSDLDAGDTTIPVSFKTDAGMQRIFLRFKYGESVTVSSQ